MTLVRSALSVVLVFAALVPFVVAAGCAALVVPLELVGSPLTEAYAMLGESAGAAALRNILIAGAVVAALVWVIVWRASGALRADKPWWRVCLSMSFWLCAAWAVGHVVGTIVAGLIRIPISSGGYGRSATEMLLTSWRAGSLWIAAAAVLLGVVAAALAIADAVRNHSVAAAAP